MIDSKNTPFLAYPEFAPSQILTHSQLNQLRDFLDEQGRLTRTMGIGAGIICGLEADYSYDHSCGQHAISICPGYGFSSDGKLIQFGKLVENEIATKYKYYRIFDKSKLDGDENDPLTLTNEDIYELVDGSVLGAELISGSVLEERVLVLYLDKSAELDEPCITVDCSNQGNLIYQQSKVLMVHIKDLMDYNQKACSDLREQVLNMPRWHSAITEIVKEGQLEQTEVDINKDHRPLETLTSRQDINRAYGCIVEDMYKPLAEAIKLYYSKYSKFLNLDALDMKEMMEVLADTITLETDSAYTQYHYALVNDLVCSLNEFIEITCKLTGDCALPTGYPNHLMLRGFIEAKGTDEYDDMADCRHVWQAAPVANHQDENWKKARGIFHRIYGAVRIFYTSSFEPHELREDGTHPYPVRITKSHTQNHELGMQAIPYYYNLRDLKSRDFLNKYWQPHLCCTTQSLQSYYFQDEKAYYANPLQFNIRKHSLFRIEGHMRKVCTEAEEAVLALRKRFNLEFDLLVTHLQDTAEAEAKTLKELISKAASPEDIQNQYDIWVREREKRSLHCDVGSIQEAYAKLREQMIAQFIDLNSLFLTYKKTTLVFTKGEEPGLLGNLETVIQMTEDLKSNLLLPYDLTRFFLPLFLNRYKSMMSTYHQFLKEFMYLASGFETEFTGEEEVLRKRRVLAMQLYREFQSMIRRFNNSLVVNLAKVNQVYETLRAEDLSLFSNIIKRTDGIEHIGGVEPGGTFIMVCDHECNTEIIADFSLASKLDCCCNMDPASINTPVLALPESEILSIPYDLTTGDFSSINFQVGAFEEAVFTGKVPEDSNTPYEIKLSENSLDFGIPIKLIDDTPFKSGRHAFYEIANSELDVEKEQFYDVDYFDYTFSPDTNNAVTGRIFILLARNEPAVVSHEHEENGDPGGGNPTPKGTSKIWVQTHGPRIGITQEKEVTITLLKQKGKKFTLVDSITNDGKDIEEGELLFAEFEKLETGNYKILGELDGDDPVSPFILLIDQLEKGKREIREVNFGEAGLGITSSLAATKEAPVKSSPTAEAKVESVVTPNIETKEEPKVEPKTTSKPKAKSKSVASKAKKTAAKPKAKKTPAPKKEEKPPAPIVPPKEKASSEVDLTQRKNAYHDEIMKLNKSGQFKGNQGFTQALDMIAEEVPSLPDLAETYEQLVKKLATSFGSSRTGRDKKLALEKMIEKTTHHFLDQAALGSEGEIPAEVSSALEEVKTKMKKSKVNLDKIRNNWDSTELESLADPKIINQLIQLIK